MFLAINLRKIDKGKSKRWQQWCDGGKEFKDESKGQSEIRVSSDREKWRM